MNTNQENEIRAAFTQIFVFWRRSGEGRSKKRKHRTPNKKRAPVFHWALGVGRWALDVVAAAKLRQAYSGLLVVTLSGLVCLALLAFSGCKPSGSVSQAKPSASP